MVDPESLSLFWEGTFSDLVTPLDASRLRDLLRCDLSRALVVFVISCGELFLEMVLVLLLEIFFFLKIVCFTLDVRRFG